MQPESLGKPVSCHVVATIHLPIGNYELSHLLAFFYESGNDYEIHPGEEPKQIRIVRMEG